MKNKEKRLYREIDWLCSKYRVTCQKNIEYNGDLHLQFRKRRSYGKSPNGKYDFYGIDFAECYIDGADVELRFNPFILMDLKGFLNLSFKNSRKTFSQK